VISRTFRVRRSCLAVPGSSAKMLAKAPGLPADQVFLDLEDAVAESAKRDARHQIVDALVTHDWGGKVRVVRINAVSTPWALEDLLTVIGSAGAHLDAVMVPKVADPGEVAFVHHVLSQLEHSLELEPGAIGLELQIEDAGALVAIDGILAASPRTETVVLGPGDMASALGMPALMVGDEPADYPGHVWHHVLSTMLVHARAAGVQVIDGPYARIRDTDGFLAQARRSRALGLDGKWVLHPAQIELANEVFGISQEEFERACDLLDALAHATGTRARGAVLFGDEMIDEATRKMAERARARGLAQGREPREVPDDVAFHERAAWRAAHGDDGDARSPGERAGPGDATA
jgi:citrate lyase subunit beta / citryl-CoA lyase